MVQYISTNLEQIRNTGVQVTLEPEKLPTLPIVRSRAVWSVGVSKRPQKQKQHQHHRKNCCFLYLKDWLQSWVRQVKK